MSESLLSYRPVLDPTQQPYDAIQSQDYCGVPLGAERRKYRYDTPPDLSPQYPDNDADGTIAPPPTDEDMSWEMFEPYDVEPQHSHLTLVPPLEISAYTEDVLNERTILDSDCSWGASRILFVGSKDYRTKAAHELEVENLTRIGDDEDVLRQEFVPYQDSSIFMLAFKRDAELTPENILGVVRLIPFSAEDSPEGVVTRNKTLRDLAIITAGHAATQQICSEETMRSYEEWLTAHTGATMDQTIDITTLATKSIPVPEGFKPALVRQQIASHLIEAMADWMLEQDATGRYKVATALNEVSAHRFFNNVLGYPFEPFMNMGPVRAIADGKMRLRPTFVALGGLEAAIRAGTTDHLRKCAADFWPE